MKKYDMVVIGSGSGMIVADEAVSHGLKVAVVDRGPLGGTCLNLGCIPSKMLIYAADRVADIQEASKLGIEAEIRSINFKSIMEHMRSYVKDNQSHMREGLARTKGMDFYEGVSHFVADYALEVNGQQIKGDKIIIASGSRPLIPPIKGLDGVDFLTNETLLQLDERPESLLIIGGGYIAVEYGHFFAAMGTRVTIIEMADRLVLAEEPEISAVLQRELSKRMAVITNAQAEEVKGNKDTVSVVVKHKDGEQKEYSAQRILVAVGRRSNADLLKVENTGVALDARGYVKVNDLLETSKKNIYAVGDANGQQMFTHVANREASVVAHNVLHNAKLKMDYSAAPHAVYSRPQIASVGMTTAQAKKDHDILVGRAMYTDVAKGEAMREEVGFAKAIVEKESGRLLGFHIIGPYAPELIQEVTNAMASGGHIHAITGGMHIHPALSELVPATLNNLAEP